jgi:hypothetical protein
MGRLRSGLKRLGFESLNAPLEGKCEMDKPKFYYDEFEDYLFKAIQLSRELTFDNCVDSDEVLRQLSLATGTVESFLTRVNRYAIKELEPDGQGVAPPNQKGDR